MNHAPTITPKRLNADMKSICGKGIIATLLCASSLLSGETAPADRFIEFQRGTLPLILEVPHDGTMTWPELSPRRRTTGGRDTNASVLALRIADRIETISGKRPTVIFLKLKREYLDANRSRTLAVDDERAGALYDEYYRRIATTIDDIVATAGCGLMINIHCGGNLGGADCYFGTNGERTIKTFKSRHAAAVFNDAIGLPALMSAKGYRIPGFKGLAPHRGWTGEVTIEHTQRHARGVDGIQIEIERTRFMHASDRLNRLGDDLGDAIFQFLSLRYCANPPVQGP